MPEQKGLVLKREGNTCLVLTPDGEFTNIPALEKVQIGEEVSLFRKATALKRVLLLAASICALFFGWLAYQAALPPVVAYVSLDFNPSLELGLDKEKKIVPVVPLDRAAEELLQNVDIKSKSFAEGVNTIVEKALASGYLRSVPEQTILAAVAPAQAEVAPAINVLEVARVLREALETKTQAKIIVVAATLEDHREAKAAGLSLGKSLLLKAAEKEGKAIPVHELKEENLDDIEVRNNFALEEIFRSQSKVKKTVIILPLKKSAGEKEKPAGDLPAQAGRQEQKTPNLPEHPQKEAEKSPLPRQKQVLPEGEAKTDRKDAEISRPELAKPEAPRPEIPEAPPPEKPEPKEPVVEKPEEPEKPIEPRQPLLPVVVPEKEAPAQEEKQFSVVPAEKIEPASKTGEFPETRIDSP